MAKRIPEHELNSIEAIIKLHPEGVSLSQLFEELGSDVPRRTLQYRLKHLVQNGRIISEGERRGTKYLPATTKGWTATETSETDTVSLSVQAKELQDYVRQPVSKRKNVGYNAAFLNSYRPNQSAYLSLEDINKLEAIGRQGNKEQPAGTYAKQILSRLLIDLSWNSSRLEGNTYSLLDTRRLIDFGEEPEGKDQIEAQMILNHKDAIEFLVGSAEDIEFNRYTILNLHALLANNLLPNPESTGRLRQMAVGIEQSTFHPLEHPQLIEECFDQILATASAIENPFEQSFFVMVQMPYLQPFDDVNKRVSRLAANIPLIKSNLIPLSFTDLPTSLYTQAILAVYELNKTDLLKEIYFWAYQRSADRYAAVRQSIGEPDPFRLKHREALQVVVSDIIRRKLDRKAAFSHISDWSQNNLKQNEREQFREIVEKEILGLHEGNFARYRVKPSEYSDWQSVWQ